MGCLENITSYSLGEARVISASGEDVWNTIMDSTSELHQHGIRTVVSIHGFDSQGRRKKDGDLFKVRDLSRVRKKVRCCGAMDVDWIITSITGNSNDYPRSVSMSVRDDNLGCDSTMTWTLDLIPDDQESCILTASFSCLPFHWKYIFTAHVHRSACKGFFRDDFDDVIDYFRRQNDVVKAADQDDEIDSTVKSTMNEGNSTASASLSVASSWTSTTDLFEEGPSFRSVMLPPSDSSSNKPKVSLSTRSLSVCEESSQDAD
jgi:hypothetical protein